MIVSSKYSVGLGTSFDLCAFCDSFRLSFICFFSVALLK